MWFLHATLAVINLILLITVVSKPRWGTLCAKESVATKSATVNPVGPVLRYEERLFDEGYGGYALNASANNGSRVMFAGRPTLAMDDAWYALYRASQFIRISPEEAAGMLSEESVMLNDGSGYLAALDVSHQLHCLDMIRKALHPEFYYYTERKTQQHDHIAHCLNYIRQKIVCDADISLLSFGPEPYGGPDSERYGAKLRTKKVCRHFEDVHDWAMQRRIRQPEENYLLRYYEAEEPSDG